MASCTRRHEKGPLIWPNKGTVVKKLGLGLLGLVVLLVAAILIAPSFIDWNAQKGRITAEVRNLTGRELAIDGDVSLAVLPAPALSAAKVRLANVEGGSAPDMVELESLKVRIAFLPLLRGEVQVESIVLVKPVIRAEVLPDGRKNWEFAAPGPDAAGDEDTGAADAGVPGGIRLDSLRIEDGTVIYRDARAGTEERIDHLNAEIAAESLVGPFAVSGQAALRGVPAEFEVSLGRLVEGGATPLSFALRLPGPDAKLQFAGALSRHGERVSLRGRVKSEGKDLAAVAAALAEPGDLPSLLAKPFSVEADVAADAERASATELMLRFGETKVEGEVQVKMGPPLDAQVRLAASRIDIDKLLVAAAAAAPGDQPAEDKTGTAAQTGQEAPAARAAPGGGGFVLPADMTGALDLSVDALVYRGQVVRQVMVSLALAEGRLKVGQALALLPGGSDVTLAGTLGPTAEGGAPGLRFDGRVEAASDNLRAVLDWLGVAVAQVPAERLRKMSLTGKIAATRDQVMLGDVDLRIDLSRATGGIAVALRERPGLGIGLAVDKLNLDAYLPKAAEAGEQAGEQAATAGAGSAPRTLPAPAGPGALAAFDANVDLRLGTLTVRGVAARGVRLDATLRRGVITLRELRVGDAVGGSARLSGTVALLADKPAVDGTFEIQVPDPVRLAKAAGLEPGMLARVGAFGLKGTLEGSMDQVSFAADLSALGGRFGASGTAQPAAVPPGFDLAVTGRHPNLAKLVRALAPEVRLDPKLGALDVVAKVAGTPQRVRISGLDATLGPVRLSGSLAANLGDPKPTLEDLDLAVAAQHPDLAALVRAVAPEATFGSGIGGVDLKARVTGRSDKIQVSDLAGKIGATEVAGAVGVDLTGAKPALDVDLSTGVLPLRAFLAPAAGSAGKAAKAPAPAPEAGGAQGQAAARPEGAERWSKEPIDVSALDRVDARVKLRSAALVFGDVRLDNAVVDAALKDGLLDLRKVSGTLYDGAVLATGKVDARPGKQGAALEAGLALTAIELNLAKVLQDVAETDRVSGPLNVDASLNTRGRSQAELVAALAGNGEIHGTLNVKAKAEEQVGAVLLGILGQKVKEIRGVTGATNLLFNAFAGAPAALRGTFTIERGVVKTTDLRVDGRKAVALTQGTADLPAWRLDTRTSVYRAEDTTKPYLTADLRGPLDKPNVRVGGQIFQRDRQPAPARPGGPQPSAEPPAPQQLKPKDILKKGLKDLLKGFGD